MTSCEGYTAAVVPINRSATLYFVLVIMWGTLIVVLIVTRNDVGCAINSSDTERRREYAEIRVSARMKT